MTNAIVFDARRNFCRDLRTRTEIHPDEYTFRIISDAQDAKSLETRIKADGYDTLLVSSNRADELEGINITGLEVIGYRAAKDDREALNTAGINDIGFARDAKELLSMLENYKSGDTAAGNDGKSSEEEEPEQKPVKSEPAAGSKQEKPDTVKTIQHSSDTEQASDAHDNDYDIDYEEFLEWRKYVKAAKAARKHTEMSEKHRQSQPAESGEYGYCQADAPPEQNRIGTGKRLVPKGAKELKSEEVLQDMITRKEPTRVIAVYAAKGGVGKTTIATEVASYLALTSYRRGTYKVCIVDYNIDFGDVRTTLGLPDNTTGMYEWANDIRDRLEAGEHMEDIHYSSKEIDRYLQTVKKTGLCALCAPVRHEESQDIGRDELEIMLRSIIDDGGFDFVICDTGNNTKDSSMFSLIYSDTVLLVATQDVTTATCNASVIEALEAFGMDMSKVKLVMNNAMSAKSTGISVQEVQAAFPYECIAIVRHDRDVIKANNLSKPIVYQPNHLVTKELQKIVAFLTGSEEQAGKKKGFFVRKGEK